MKDIIRMNQLAGLITEGQARKMMEVLNEADSDVEKLKDYLETYSFGMEVLDEPESTVHFEIWEDRAEAMMFKKFLTSLGIKFTQDSETDGGYKVYMFDVDKAQIKSLFGLSESKNSLN